MKLTSLTDTFLITNTPSINEAEEFDRHVLDHQYSLHWWSWRVWQTRSWSPILPPLKKLKSLTDTFFITNTPSIDEAEEFDRHVLDHQYSTEETEEFDRHVLHHQYSPRWRSCKIGQTRSWSPILPPLMKLKSLTDTFLITNTPSINEAEEFDRHVLDHQYSLHWMKLKSLTDTFLITNTPSINEADEFDRHVLDHQYSLHWRSWRVWQTPSWSPILPPLRSWRVWQTRSWSPILPPLMKLTSLTDTFLITNTPSVVEAVEFDRHVLDHQYSLHWRNWRVWQTRHKSPSMYEAVEFDRHVLDHQYSLHWWSWRVWQTRSWSPILPPLKKLKSLTDTFFITNTPSTILITNTDSTEEAEEFDRHVLDHQYRWRSSTFWSPILPPLKKLKSLTDTFLITNTPYINEADEFDRHVLDHQYSLHWWSWRVWQTRSWSPILPPLKKLKSLTDTFFITNTPSIDEAEEFDRHVLHHQYSPRWRSCKIGQTRFDHQYSLH